MIATGEKKEEYREIKPYWINRLCIEYKWMDLKINNPDSYSYSSVAIGLDFNDLNLYESQYLQQRGFALPVLFIDEQVEVVIFSVDELVENGVVKLIEK